MATADDYAKWIVDNQDKKGTPEFDTVAQAYQLAKTESKPKMKVEGFGTKPEDFNPTSGMSGGQKFLAGAGKAFSDIGRGVKQLTGFGDQGEIDAAKKRDAALMKTGAGMAGNMVGSAAVTAPALAIPGGATYKGAALIGAGIGALNPTASDDSRAENMLYGGIGGIAGQGIANAAARVVRPNTSKEAALLLKEGVTPTPGQLMGGTFQTVEDKLTSVPLLGEAINSARKKGLNEFNRAAYARALEPIGEKAPNQIGREGVEKVSDALSNAYEGLLPQMKFGVGQQYQTDMNALSGLVKSLPKREAKEFQSIVQREITDRLTGSGLASGETLKTIESQLGKEASRFSGATDAYQQKLGDAIKEAQAIFKAQIERSNPNLSDELKSINKGYANYARIRDAASRQGSLEGVFTPAQLSAAVRAGDKSVGKGNFAKGNALMQDLTDAGKSVLAPKYPDSGTVGRGLLAGATGAGIGAGGYAINPMIAGGAGLAMLPYLPGGRQAMAALLARRPDAAVPIAGLLRQAAPISGLLGASYGAQQ